MSEFLKKTTLTITLCKKDCEKLKRLIPEGKISTFIGKLVGEAIQKLEKEVANEYQKANQDQTLHNQLKKWDIFKQDTHKKTFNEKKR